MVAEQVAAVTDHGDATGLVHDLAHAIPLVLADRHAPAPPLQQVLGRDQAAPVRQPSLVQLVADVFDHVVGRGPRPAGGTVGDDLVVQVHVRQVLGAVQAQGVRARVVAAQRLVIVEGGLAHAQRIEDQVLHGLVVGRPDLEVRIDQMAADEAGGRGHQVVVLERLAELGGGLGARQQGEGVQGGRAPLGVEDPLHVLARQARAGADEVLHQHLAGGLVAAEAESGIGLGHRLVPSEFALVHQPGQHQGGHALGVGRDHEPRVGVHRVRLAERLHAEAAFEHHLIVVDQGHRDARDLQLVHRGLDEGLQGGDALRIQPVRGPAGEGLARLPDRLQRAREQRGRPGALLQGGLVDVDQQHGPARPFARGDGDHRAVLVGRDVVDDLGPGVPELPRRQGGGQQNLASHAGRTEHRPGLRGGIGPILGLARIDDDDVGIPLRWAHVHPAGPAPGRPVLGQGEGDAEGRDLGRVGGRGRCRRRRRRGGRDGRLGLGRRGQSQSERGSGCGQPYLRAHGRLPICMPVEVSRAGAGFLSIRLPPERLNLIAEDQAAKLAATGNSRRSRRGPSGSRRIRPMSRAGWGRMPTGRRR